jgi:hypothetical protein
MEELVIKIDKIENKNTKQYRNIIGWEQKKMINLKLSDINSKLMQIEIRGAKGKRPPCTTNRKTREILRLYIEYKPRCIYSTVNLVYNTQITAATQS